MLARTNQTRPDQTRQYMYYTVPIDTPRFHNTMYIIQYTCDSNKLKKNRTNIFS